MARAYRIRSTTVLSLVGATITSKGTYDGGGGESHTRFTATSDKSVDSNGIASEFIFASPGEKVMHKLWVFAPPFTSSFVIRTIHGILGSSGGGASAVDRSFGFTLHAWLTQGASDIMRGTPLIDNWVQADTDDPWAGAVGRQIPTLECAQVVGQPGDILVVETGAFHYGIGASFSYAGAKDSSGNPLPDLTLGMPASAGAGWLEWSLGTANVPPDTSPRFPPSIIVDDPTKPTQPWDAQCAGGGETPLGAETDTVGAWCS